MSDPSGPDDTPEGNAPPAEGERPLEPGSPEGAASTVASTPPDSRKVVAQRGYEMGLSLRVIGAQVGVSSTTIRKWAQEGGWVAGRREKQPQPTVKLVAEQVDAPPSAKVIPLHGARAFPAGSQGSHFGSCEPGGGVNCEPGVNHGNDKPLEPERAPLDERFRARVRHLLENPSPDEAVDVAARAVVQVVHQHRRGVLKAQAIVDKLLMQLEVAADNRDLLEEFIHENFEPGKYRSMLMRLIQLPSHAGTIKDLAGAMQRLVFLERQTYGLGATDDPTPPPEPEKLPEAKVDEFDRIRERARLRLAGPQQEAQP